jgi:hypothetical protein
MLRHALLGSLCVVHEEKAFWEEKHPPIGYGYVGRVTAAYTFA